MTGAADTTMRAAVAPAPGQPMQVCSVPRPKAQAGHVLVRIQASGVNPLDVKIHAGAAPHAQQSLPAILGLDLAGVIEAVGEGMQQFLPGDEVYGMTGGVGGHPTRMPGTHGKKYAGEIAFRQRVWNTGAGLGEFIAQGGAECCARTVDQTQALHKLWRRGIEIATEDLAHFSPYPTGRVKRFGQYPASITAEPQPPNKCLPPRPPSTVAQAA